MIHCVEDALDYVLDLTVGLPLMKRVAPAEVRLLSLAVCDAAIVRNLRWLSL